MGDLEVDVDVSTKAPIPAFCSSDEEDATALLYLPIAPEVDDPEDSFIPDQEDSPGKRVAEQKENASPKKKRTKTVDIELAGAPLDEVHPMLHKSASKERGASKKVQGRPSNKEKGKSKGK